MRRGQHLFVSGQRQVLFDQARAVVFGMVERAEQSVDIRLFKVVPGLLDFVLMIDVALGNSTERSVGPDQVKNAFDILQIHGEPFDAVSDLAGYRSALEAANLLEVGELRDLHAVQPDFPAEAPGAKRR